MNRRIDWPELRFPPINLWVMAALPRAGMPHRKQRPVAPSRGVQGAQAPALHEWMQGRSRMLGRMLAMRSGGAGGSNGKRG